jgi:hypothetical protein
MIGLRDSSPSSVVLGEIQHSASSGPQPTAALKFAQSLQVGTSPFGIIRLAPDDMRAPCRAGPGSYRWSSCESVLVNSSRFIP